MNYRIYIRTRRQVQDAFLDPKSDPFTVFLSGIKNVWIDYEPLNPTYFDMNLYNDTFYFFIPRPKNS